jgi:hypothetical protein
MTVSLPIACSLCTSSRGPSAVACMTHSNINRLRVRLLRHPLHGYAECSTNSSESEPQIIERVGSTLFDNNVESVRTQGLIKL